MKQYLVYALLDPDTKEVRYIGKSATGLRRPTSHLKAYSYNESNTHKNRWIRSVVRADKLPLVHVLAELTSEDEAYAAEVDYIKLYKHLGARLTNYNNGGRTGEGGKPSLEVRQKMSHSHSTRVRPPIRPEDKKRLQTMNLGRKRTKDSIAKQINSYTGTIQPISQVQKRAESRRRPILASLPSGEPVCWFTCLKDAGAYFPETTVSTAITRKKLYKGFVWTRLEKNDPRIQTSTTA